MIFLRRFVGLAVTTTVVLFFSVSSCSKDTADRIECDEFRYMDNLAWFAGIPGDSLHFSNEQDSIMSFVIAEKHIFQVTSYLTGRNCNCHDVWGIMLENGPDTISMYSQFLYDQSVEVRYDNLVIKVDEELSGFLRQDITLVEFLTIGDVVFEEALRFQFAQNSGNKFRTVHVAREVGIVRMERMNGEVWTNTQPQRNLRIDFDSFDYSESTCE